MQEQRDCVEWDLFTNKFVFMQARPDCFQWIRVSPELSINNGGLSGFRVLRLGTRVYLIEFSKSCFFDDLDAELCTGPHEVEACFLVPISMLCDPALALRRGEFPVPPGEAVGARGLRRLLTFRGQVFCGGFVLCFGELAQVRRTS